MTTRTLPKLLKLIKENKKFLIVSHINPEGDAIGSGIALALGLKKLGKYVYILSKDPLPDILKFLPHSDLINTKIPSMNFDVLLMIDCNTIERTGFKNLTATATVIIDHHLTVRKNRIPHGVSHCGKRLISMIDPQVSATGELIYRLLNALPVSIDKKIATNLYTAILVDTGGFRYSNTSAESLRIASKLVEAGADPWEITKEVYQNFSFNRLRLLALSLSTIEMEGKIAWITVTQNMFKKTKTSVQDTENLTEYPRNIKDIEVAFLIREDGKNSYKISFRSKGKANVANIAKTFGGGGHASAAGCNLNGTLQEVKNKVLKAVRNAIKKN